MAGQLGLAEHEVVDLLISNKIIAHHTEFRDRHFEMYIRSEIGSILKCFCFITKLEQECPKCDKAQTIRSYLFGPHGELWRTDKRWLTVMTLARHIHCKNHLAKSYCLRGSA